MLRGRESDNVEDARGLGGGAIALGGGGLGTLVIIIAALVCGIDPRQLLNDLPGQTTQTTQTRQQSANGATEDDQKAFARSVLGSTEDVWGKILPEQTGNRFRYHPAKLVLFTNSISSACGRASSATGPFYCPGDEKLYLDFAFFKELKSEFNAPGDFAQAYVIAHEVGHHVQNIVGTMDKVNSQGENNQLSVRLELQADCYAGVWAFYANKQGLVEAGDAEEALKAASSVGDDAIQKRTQGYVVPESFTHGSASQRMSWFSRGMQSGDMRQCNTFQ